jgi:broad specificity phosphatase PhoE
VASGAGVGGTVPPMSTRALVVRHGQSTWNALGRWQGHADPPLSRLGEEQAEAAADRVAGVVTGVYTSDLARARRTAQIVADRLSTPLWVDPRLRERQAGPWTGLTRDEIAAGWSGHLEGGRPPPGFEGDHELVARVLSALRAICAGRTGSPPGVDGAAVLVVTHGGVVRVLERHLGGAAGLVPNLSGRWIELGDGNLVLGDRVRLLEHATATAPEQV